MLRRLSGMDHSVWAMFKNRLYMYTIRPCSCIK